MNCLAPIRRPRPQTSMRRSGRPATEGSAGWAEYLLARGVNINATPEYSGSAPLQVAAQPDTQRQALVDWLREHGAMTACLPRNSKRTSR